MDLTQGEDEVDFAGVIFCARGWKPRAAVRPGKIGQGPRDAASRLGQILWALRVRSALHARHEGLLQHEALMEVYQRVGAAGSLADWNGGARLSHPDHLLLQEYERQLEGHTWVPWPQEEERPLAPDEDAEWVMATDAYTRGLGFVFFPATPGGGPIWEHQALPETVQVVAEAMAVPWACTRLHQRTGRRPRRLVVAVDADSVRAAINKGYARSADIRAELRTLFAFCGQVRAVRVPGVMNAADGPSRGTLPGEPQLTATWEILRQAMGRKDRV